jgi:hypothetical protein
MELVLGLIVIIGLGIYYGFFGAAETVARMANRKVERLESEQIKADIAYYNENEVKKTEFDKAVNQKAQYAAYRSL